MMPVISWLVLICYFLHLALLVGLFFLFQQITVCSILSIIKSHFLRHGVCVRGRVNMWISRYSEIAPLWDALVWKMWRLDPGVGQTEEFSFSLCHPGEQWPLSSIPRTWHKVWYSVGAWQASPVNKGHERTHSRLKRNFACLDFYSP